MTDPPKLIYSVAEAARMLGVGKTTLQRKVRAGTVPYTEKVNGQRGLTQADIDSIVAAGRREPTPS